MRTTLVSPYARYNLRRNPFGELTRAERAELAVVNVRPWIESLDRTTVLQFLADKGRGKTTHLLAIERSLPGAIYVYLPEDGPLPPIPDHRPLLIDETQRLSRSQRRRVFSIGGPLVLGTHEDFSSEMTRANLKVTTVHVGADLNAEQLTEILNRRIEASRAGRLPGPNLSREHAIALQQRFGNNIREIEQHLYDEFQDAAEKGAPWPPPAI